jgi:hypothetical protein
MGGIAVALMVTGHRSDDLNSQPMAHNIIRQLLPMLICQDQWSGDTLIMLSLVTPPVLVVCLAHVVLYR